MTEEELQGEWVEALFIGSGWEMVFGGMPQSFLVRALNDPDFNLLQEQVAMKYSPEYKVTANRIILADIFIALTAFPPDDLRRVPRVNGFYYN